VTPPLPGLDSLPTYLGGAEQSSSRVELSCPHPSRLELMQVRVSTWWPTEPRFDANNTSVKVWPCEPYSNLELGSANETLRYFWSISGFTSRTLVFSCIWLDSRCSPIRWPLWAQQLFARILQSAKTGITKEGRLQEGYIVVMSR
jgi:hypothetical protein